MIYQNCLVPVLERNQTIFPMKVNEIKEISILVEETEQEHRYMGLNDEQIAEFVIAMNQIVLKQGEEAKGSIAYNCFYETKGSSPKSAPRIVEIKVNYKKNPIQLKEGIILYFYEDNSFMLDEIQTLYLIPFTSRVFVTHNTVYQHGRVVFADGSENQEAAKALLQLIEDYKLWFAEH